MSKYIINDHQYQMMMMANTLAHVLLSSLSPWHKYSLQYNYFFLFVKQTLGQARSPSYNPPVVRGCNPLLECFGSNPAAHPGKPVLHCWG